MWAICRNQRAYRSVAVANCPLRLGENGCAFETQSPPRVAENRRDRVTQIDSVMRVSGHRFQTKVTISVSLRCSASPPRSLRFSGPRSLRARQLRDRGVGQLGPLWLRPEAALSFQGPRLLNWRVLSGRGYGRIHSQSCQPTTSSSWQLSGSSPRGIGRRICCRSTSSSFTTRRVT
jgi:hypothetical protein